MKTPFLKLYGDDWYSGTRMLTMEQKGFFLELLLLMWDRKAGVPCDPKWLSSSLHIDPRQARRLTNDLIRLGKLEAVDGTLVNARMMRDIDRTHFGEKSTEDLPDFSEKSAEDLSKIAAKKSKNTTKSTCDQISLARAHFQKPEARVQKEEVVGRDDLPTPSASAEKLPSPKTKKGSRLSDAWTLPEDWRQWARVNFPASTDATVTAEADKFRDYWIAQTGTKATKADWQATWRNWCRVGLSRMPAKGQPMNWGRNAYDETAIWKKPHVRKPVIDTSSRAYWEEIDRKAKEAVDAVWGPEPEWMTPPEKRPKSKEELAKLAADGWMW